MERKHQIRVQRVAESIKQLYAAKKPFRIYHGSTNSTRVLSFKKDEMVDISSFNHIVSIDAKRRIAHVEPNVSMDQLVKATLQYGLVPAIVMEFPGITVGGAIQGNGGESSSFKWGTFNQICPSFELITPNGDRLVASHSKHADLYDAVPGSAGTIAVLTAAEIQLIPAKKYVELRYIPIASFVDARNTIVQESSGSADYVDGIMFSKTSGVVIVGTFSAKPSQRVERFSRAHDQWYYLHVDETLRKHPDGWTESVPIVDYLFRYDRGGFWVGRFAFTMFGVPYTRYMRWLLNPILHTRKLYQALQESGASEQHIVQDLVLPHESFVEFCECIDQKLQTYPLWMCPMLPNKNSPFQLNAIETNMILNVGVWGDSIPDHKEFIAANRLIEKIVLRLGGKKWSYAHSYFTEKEFWSMYDKDQYDAIRNKYHATALPTIYDKVTVRTRHPLNRRKAVVKTIFGLSKIRIVTK